MYLTYFKVLSPEKDATSSVCDALRLAEAKVREDRSSSRLSVSDSTSTDPLKRILIVVRRWSVRPTLRSVLSSISSNPLLTSQSSLTTSAREVAVHVWRSSHFQILPGKAGLGALLLAMLLRRNIGECSVGMLPMFNE